MTEKNNVKLIETMSSLMLISSQDGILIIEPIVDQVKESILQKSPPMAIDGYQ